MTKQTKTRGFTIVELLIVIVVIAILAAITIVAYNGIQNRAKTSAGQQLASNIAKKIEIYNSARTTGTGYPTHAELTATTSAVREAQLDVPGSVINWASTGAELQTTIANYNNNKNVIYRRISATGGCVFYWDFGDATPAFKYLRVGSATTGNCDAVV